jgi:hypothetical protein
MNLLDQASITRDKNKEEVENKVERILLQTAKGKSNKTPQILHLTNIAFQPKRLRS